MEENKITLFNNPEFGEVRVVDLDGEPWFVGKDVAQALGYAIPKDAISRHIDSDDKLRRCFNSSGQNREMTIINESGVYSLVFRSKLESAKKFKHWVTSEILPSVRKHGAYMTPDMIEKVLYNPDVIIGLATNLKEEKEKNKVLTDRNTRLALTNNALIGTIREWDIRDCVVALVRAYSSRVKRGVFAYGWADFYKNLNYKYGIDAKKRRARADKTRPCLDYLTEDEMQLALKISAAMCENRGISIADVINETNDLQLEPLTSGEEFCSVKESILKREEEDKENRRRIKQMLSPDC